MEIIKPYCESEEYSNRYTQSFDKTKITIVKAGKEYNVYDYIQAQREDTEIYPTLEKYGNIKALERPAKEVYADVSNALELRDLLDQDKKLEELFYSLPLEERREFDNDFYKFKANGLEYYNKKAIKEIEKNRKLREEQENTPVKVEITNNTAKDKE